VAVMVITFALVGCGAPPRRIIVDDLATAPRSGVGAAPLPTVYDPKPVSVLTGKSSYYYGRSIGRKTANGEIYRASDITAAHKTLPFNTMVRVTNLNNGKSVIVRINNRGPFIKGRILDLSLEAAKKIDMTKAGVVSVRAEVLRKIPVIEKSNLKAKVPLPKPKPMPAPATRPRPTPAGAVTALSDPTPTPAQPASAARKWRR
jgi:rare lipoprotein A